VKKLPWLLLVGAGLALAQAGGLLPPGGRAYPRPSWIQPGLLVAYTDGVGQTAAAYLVTRVAGGRAYGLALTLFQSEAGPTLQVQAEPLYDGGSGPFVVHPAAVRDFLQNPPPGVQAMGVPGQLGVVIQDPDGVTKHAVRYDPQSGLVTEVTSSYRAPAGVGPRRSVAVHLVLAGRRRVAWRVVEAFPPAARAAARYQVLYALAGGTAPGGTVTVTPAGGTPPLARYRVEAAGAGELQPPSVQYGLPVMGPHYLHPALLARTPLLQVPELGLVFQVAGRDPSGAVWVAATAGGRTFERLAVDPQSGAVLEQEIAYPGMGTAIYRRLP